MPLRIRFATPEDAPILYRFIRELAEYEREPDAVEVTPEQLHAQLSQPRPPFECLLAEDGDGTELEARGFALFFSSYSTWRGRPGLYLEDLYVPSAHRGAGVGRALLATLARLACERGCARLEWSVLDWNTPAIGFYERLGAIAMSEWTTHRLTGDALQRMASEGPAVSRSSRGVSSVPMFQGTLEAIFTAPASGEPMLEHASIEATAAVGLAGDRYATNVARHERGYTKVRAVTLIEEETIEALRRDHDIDVLPIELRRNLLTRGVPLNHLIGRRFRVGEVVLEGTELSEPCQYVADLIEKPVLEPLLHRGGIRAAIVEGGQLRAGDEIVPLPDPTDPKRGSRE